MHKKKKWGNGRKSWREPYSRSKKWDKGCRCHGGCGYCHSNRVHNLDRKQRYFADKEVRDYEQYGPEDG